MTDNISFEATVEAANNGLEKKLCEIIKGEQPNVTQSAEADTNTSGHSAEDLAAQTELGKIRTQGHPSPPTRG